MSGSGGTNVSRTLPLTPFHLEDATAVRVPSRAALDEGAVAMATFPVSITPAPELPELGALGEPAGLRLGEPAARARSSALALGGGGAARWPSPRPPWTVRPPCAGGGSPIGDGSWLLLAPPSESRGTVGDCSPALLRPVAAPVPAPSGGGGGVPPVPGCWPRAFASAACTAADWLLNVPCWLKRGEAPTPPGMPLARGDGPPGIPPTTEPPRALASACATASDCDVVFVGVRCSACPFCPCRGGGGPPACIAGDTGGLAPPREAAMAAAMLAGGGCLGGAAAGGGLLPNCWGAAAGGDAAGGLLTGARSRLWIIGFMVFDDANLTNAVLIGLCCSFAGAIHFSYNKYLEIYYPENEKVDDKKKA